MKIQTALPTLALTFLFLLHPSSSILAQGPLTPPGAPAPTMKTLDQVEARTPISALPFTISTGGSYYLTSNLQTTGGVAINITADGVTLDLNGFTITSTASPASGFGIQLSSGRRNVVIQNGNLQGAGTITGGVFSGPGFLQGISYSGTGPQNVRISGVNISGCQTRGILLGSEYSTAVAQCNVRTVGGYGITVGTVSDTVVTDCTGTGIEAKTASNCTSFGGTGRGLLAETAADCKGSSTDGTGLNAEIASNCRGSSATGKGLEAEVASGCKGSSGGSSPGLDVITASNCRGGSDFGAGVNAVTATNCHGTSSSAAGVTATNVLNSYGNSVSGSGLLAVNAQNSYGASNGSATGLNALISAIGCYGFSSSGTGLAAFIANICSGGTSTGTALSTTHNVNSF
jgi:hypothetical protein